MKPKPSLPRVTKLGLRESLDKVFAQLGITQLEIILPVTQAAWDYLKGGQAEFVEDDGEASSEEVPAPKVAVKRDEVREFIKLFCNVSKLPEPRPTTVKERAAAGEAWYQPARRMIQMANGSSLKVLEIALREHIASGLDLRGPRSIESKFATVYGRMQRQNAKVTQVSHAANDQRARDIALRAQRDARKTGAEVRDV